MNVERKIIILDFVVELVLNDPKGMKGTIANAKEILANTPNGYVRQQFESVVKPKVLLIILGVLYMKYVYIWL